MKTLRPGDFVETEVVTNREFVLAHTSSYVVVLEGEQFVPPFFNESISPIVSYSFALFDTFEDEWDISTENFDSAQVLLDNPYFLLGGTSYTRSAPTTTNGIYKEPLFHSIKAQFYNQEYKTETTQSLGTTLTLIQVSQSLFDEKIKEGSVTLFSGSTTFIDDSVGNLKVSGSDTHIGNVFYEFGSIVITDTGSYSNVGLDEFDLTFRATHKKRTLHFQAPVEPSEFNYSTNPTIRIRGETQFDRPRYTYTLSEVSNLYGQTINENTIIPEFFGFDPSGSEETALTPYVTTVGWYDEIGNLLAAAKLATPTPIPRDFPITFKARIDI